MFILCAAFLHRVQMAPSPHMNPKDYRPVYNINLFVPTLGLQIKVGYFRNV
jgi:hypothetical protein